MLIVDASVFVKLFVDEELEAEARHIFAYQQDIGAPDFVLVEVANILWKKVRRGEVEPDAAKDVLRQLPDYLTRIVPTRDIVEPATALALDLEHPVYDCLYLASATGEHDAVVTADRRFFDVVKASPHAARIKFLDDIDLALPLHIPLHKVEEIVRSADLVDRTIWNAFDGAMESNEKRQINPDDHDLIFNNPAAKRLHNLLGELTEIERRDIFALGYLGIGDPDWDTSRINARQFLINENPIDAGNLASHASDGLTKLRAEYPP